ncbi:MAG: hypothetical protein WBO73_18980 [Gammaproteobacteria bacterium]|jgi:hypothetical protein
MEFKKTHIIVTGFIALSVFGIVYVLAIPVTPSQPQVGVFEKAGYQVLVPYVDEQPPGYFDTVEHSTKSEISLHRTCDIPYGEIEPYIKKTRTVDERISRKLEAGVEVDASVLSTQGSVSLEGVNQVQVRYENSAIWYLTTESLYSIREKYIRGACQAAIERDLKKHLAVCQTKKVIVSDIVFEVTYESGSKTKLAASADSISGSAYANGTGSHDFHGKKMFHAVKLDKDCFRLNTSQATSREKTVDQDNRKLHFPPA